MPQILRIGPYSIYFWSNEGDADYLRKIFLERQILLREGFL